jgi:hypothetical protein
MYCFDTPSEAARCSWMGLVVGSCSSQSQTACFIARDCSAVCLRGARARFLCQACSQAAVGRHQRLRGKSNCQSSTDCLSLPTAFSHSLLSRMTGHKTPKTQVIQRVTSGSVRGATRNGCPYRARQLSISIVSNHHLPLGRRAGCGSHTDLHFR